MISGKNIFASFSAFAQFVYSNGINSASGSISRGINFDTTCPTGDHDSFEGVACQGYAINFGVGGQPPIAPNSVFSLNLHSFFDMNGGPASWQNLQFACLIHEAGSESLGTLTLTDALAGSIAGVRTCDLTAGQLDLWGCLAGDGLFFSSPNSNISIVHTDIDHPATATLLLMGN